MTDVTQVETVDTELVHESENEPKDMFSTYITTSSKLRKKMIDIYAERIEHQREILEKKVELDKDIAHKNLYNEYLQEITTIEKEAVDQLNKLSIEREVELANDKDELYTYFDNARKKLEKWKETNPKRYETEMAYLDKNEREKIQTIEENALQLFEQSQKMFDETVEIFYNNDKEINKL
jgi:hypothetical protein